MVFDNNVVFGFKWTGVGFNSIMSTTFNNNFVGHIRERADLEVIGGTLDKHGGVLFCTLNPSNCPGLRITNNIVAGSVFVGFTAPAHDCDASNP